MRTTRASISLAVRGRPDERWAAPSYFWATSFRCQANKVSGVTMLATSASTSRPQRFGLYGQSPALMVIEAHSPVTELFSKRPILLAKVVNDLQLAVVHPPETAISINRNGSIPLCVFKTHYRNRGAAVPNPRIFMQIQFSGHTGSHPAPWRAICETAVRRARPIPSSAG